MTESEFTTAKALSERIDVPAETLSKWRQMNFGPPYYRLPGMRVRYKNAEVDAWLAQIRVEPPA